MNNAIAEKFALENDLELDEIISFFRGVDNSSDEDLE